MVKNFTKFSKEMDPSIYKGKKFITISTSNVIGGKNVLTHLVLFTIGLLLLAAGCILIYLGTRVYELRHILTSAGEGKQVLFEDDNSKLQPSLMMNRESREGVEEFKEGDYVRFIDDEDDSMEKNRL